MKKIIFIILFITSTLSIASAEMNNEEFFQVLQYCKNGNKTSCQYLIDNGNPPTLKKCNKNSCRNTGLVYEKAGYTAIAIEYYKKAISLGDEWGIRSLGGLYYNNKDYINAKKYFELAIKVNKELRAWGFLQIGFLYYAGEGVRQDYKKAFEYATKSCDMGVGENSGASCAMVGTFYRDGIVVKQNLSITKEYYGKGCDLGYQYSCGLYNELNKQGVK